jgi:endo-1,4-beta-xylanase
MRATNIALALSVVLGASACSSPLRSNVDASRSGTGGSESGTGGAGGTKTSDALPAATIDAFVREPDVAMVPPDAFPREGVDLGAGTGGIVAAGGAGGSGGAGGTAATGTAVAGGAGGNLGTGQKPSMKKFVGNTDTSGEVRSDFLEYWDQLTPENSGKLQSVSSEYMQYDWSVLDGLYAFTRRNRIPFHEIAFIYQTSAPSPLGNGDKARAGIEDWIRSFCARYPDTELIDVIYEPLHSPVTFKEALGGAGASGYDWMVQAFKWARAYCPRSILLLTDYNNIEYQSENQATIEIVNALMAAGAPIDAIGAEAHDVAKVRTSTVKAYIDKLAATGLPIYITEYDIADEDDDSQKATMMEQFPMFWTDDRIKGVTYWGYVVGETWRRGTGLVNADGTPRPALTWLMSYLAR